MRQGGTFLLGALVAAVLLVGCGPPWEVVKKSGPPSALKDVREMGVRFDYQGISLGGESEQEFLARQPESDKRDYERVKDTIDRSFYRAFAVQLPDVTVVPAEEGAQPAPITLTVQWSYMVMGKYAFIYTQDSELEAHLVFQTPDGTVTDHIVVRARVDANEFQMKILQRMDIAAQRLAELGAMFYRRAQQAPE